MAIIKGTVLDDVLVDLAGVDTITGVGGNDVILVAASGDHPLLEGIDGGAGYDRLWFTAAGPDAPLVLRAGVKGVEAVEIVDAVGNATGTGALNVDASALAAIVTGFTLAGNAGINMLTGTKGFDIIIGGAGADTIVGGLGKDRVVMDVTSIDSINAGALAESNTLALVGIAPELAKLDLTLADQLVAFGATLDDVLLQTGFANVDASELTNFGFQVTGSSVKNVLIGSAQDDVFIYAAAANLGTDIVSGGVGDDVIRFTSTTAAQALTLTAAVTGVEMAMISNADGVTTGMTALNLSAAAVKSAMKLTGNDGKNLITGTAFADVLNGNGGADTLTGGAGNDIFVVDSQADAGPLDKYTDAMGTDDRIVFTSTVADETLTFGTGAVTGIEAVYTTDLAFAVDNVLNLNVNGSALAVGLTYVGNAGANIFTGGTGKDRFIGNAGSDSIVGGAGADTIVMDVSSPDSINAGQRAEGNILTLVGAAGAPVAVNFNVADDVTDQVTSLAQTQAGLTHIDASALRDAGLIVTGAPGANSIAGSGQDDIFLFALGSHLTTADRITGGDGEDSIRFTASLLPATVAGRTLTLPGAYIKGVEIAEIADANGDTSGTTALNIVAATMTAITLRGNDGANTLTGTKFDDTLEGNLGVDNLQGGLGNDTYLYTAVGGFEVGEKISDSGGTADIVKFDSAVPGVLVVTSAAGIEAYILDKGTNITVALGFDLSAPTLTTVTAGTSVQGNYGDNTLIGTKGADTISGFLGSDNINGGLGNDSIDGNERIDTIVGGAGNDTITAVAEEMDEIHAGQLAGENNLLRLTGDAATPVIMNLNLADQVLSGAGVQDGITFVNASGMAADVDPDAPIDGLIITGRTGAASKGDNIIGSPRQDVFTPGLGADTIEGGGADDRWIVTSQLDMNGDIYTDSGGTAGDYINFNWVAGSLNLSLTDANVGAGIDAASALGAANLNISAARLSHGFGLQGNSGNNVLTGTAFRDTFFDFFGGRDTMIGGLGPDSYVIDAWHPFDKIIDSGGFDEFYYTAVLPTDVLVLTNGAQGSLELFAVASGNLNTEGVGIYTRDITVLFDGGIDAHLLTTNAIHLAGSYGNNELTGTILGDTIIGWKGHDTISGLGGNDTITMDVADLDTDEIHAGETTGDQDRLLLQGAPVGVVEVDLAAVDQVVSIDGVAELLVQDGFDRYVDASDLERPDGALDTENFGVILKGTAGNDTFVGSDEDDVFIGRLGADSMSGGGGDDAFAFTLLTELTTADTLNGGAGDDAVWFTSVTAGQTLTLNPLVLLNIEEARVADTTGATTGLTALNINASVMTSAMTLAGNDGANVLTGTIGADTLIGNGGEDNLVGGAGNDLYLIQLAGEVVNGGTALTSDRISELAAGGSDTLRFISEVAGGVVLTPYMANLEAVEIWDGPDTLVGSLALDLDASLLPDAVKLTGSKFNNQITGTAFADSIDGGLGNDSLFGGGGADTFTTSLEDDTSDDIDGGLTAEGNMVILAGALTLAMEWDLTSGADQLVTAHSAVGGLFLGITHLDLSALTGDFGITITGTAEANTLITGKNDDLFITATPFAPGETITAGLGDDTLRFMSAIDGQTLQLTASITGIENVEATGAADLNINAALVTSALSITGNAGDNALTGTLKADTIIGGGGVDSIVGGTALGDADDIQITADTALSAINAGLASEGNRLAVSGTLAGAFIVDLSNTLATGDQITGGGDLAVQRGFMHFDASGMTAASVSVTGSIAANRIVGTAQADSINGGLGADTIGVHVDGGSDTINGGLVTEGNVLLLLGAGGATVDLQLVDQLTSLAGDQSGFMHVDASALGAGAQITGSAAGNRIVGSALADTVAGGAGADTFVWDAATPGDTMDAGDPGDGDTFVAIGTATANLAVNLSVAPGGDQFTSIVGTQSDFQHVDAMALEGFALNARGNALNNNFAGTALADTLIGGAGSDILSLGLLDEVTDFVSFETRADGVNSIAAAFSFDRIKEFEVGRDELRFTGEFNTPAGRFDLDDIANNNTFAFITDAKANFSATHEALMVSSAKSGITTEAGLATFASVITAIRKFGVIAAVGDDGLIVVQTPTRAGLYYYQESDGISNAVTAGELTLLGIVEAKAGTDDFSFG